MLEVVNLLGVLEGPSLLAELASTGAGSESPVASQQFWSVSGIFTLGMLVLLQAVLGFDNLLYISIESKRVPTEKQSMVRRWGIGLAIAFRIGLLFVVVNLIENLKDPFFTTGENDFLSMALTGHSLIVLFGGAFILWTAVKEIYHMLASDDLSNAPGKAASTSVKKAVTLIVIMNLVFSFDSILSAMALTSNFAIMAVAIVISGLLMMWAADFVAEFLRKNRMYEVLGLFVLFIVGVMLVSEGGHLAEVQLGGHHITPMAKSTFYFVLAVLILVDVVQSQYQKKLLAQRERLSAESEAIANSER
jgi:predicted tellurium resistance membrane protein TerC